MKLERMNTLLVERHHGPFWYKTKNINEKHKKKKKKAKKTENLSTRGRGTLCYMLK